MAAGTECRPLGVRNDRALDPFPDPPWEVLQSLIRCIDVFLFARGQPFIEPARRRDRVPSRIEAFGKVSDYTPAQIEEGIAEALKARDFPAVVSLLKMLALRDPHRAKVVYESMTTVLDIMSAATEGAADD